MVLVVAGFSDSKCVLQLVFLSVLWYQLIAFQSGEATVLYWTSQNSSDSRALIYYVDEDPKVWIPQVKAGGSLTKYYLRASAEYYHFGAISTSQTTKSIYWANKVKRRIQTIEGVSEGETKPTTYGFPVSEHVNGVATDWVNENIYLTDANYNWILLVKERGAFTYQDILVDSELEEPFGIAVHPTESYVFWTDAGKARVERAALDGSQRTVIVSSGLVRPTAMTLDYPNNALYWVDVGSNNLFTSDLDGKNFRPILSSSTVSGLVGLSFYDVFLFGLSNSEKKIKIWEIRGGNPLVPVNVDLTPDFPVFDLEIMSSQQQRLIRSPCSTKFCEMEDICVTKNRGMDAECVCSSGHEKSTSHASCQRQHFGVTPPSYLFNTNRILVLETTMADEIRYEVKYHNLSSVGGALDPVSCLLSENRIGHVYRPSQGNIEVGVLQEGGGTYVQFVHGIYNITGLVGDWLHDNVYWLDGTRKQILAARHDGKHPTIVLDGLGGYPRALAVDPVARKLYWGEQEGGLSRIMRCNLDGSAKSQVVNGIGIVGQITIDFRTQRMYWTDLTNNKIEYSSLTGSNRQTFLHGAAESSIFGIAIFEDYIAWTDRGNDDSFGIHWAITATKEKVNHYQNRTTMLPLYGGEKPGYISTYDTFREKFPNNDACTRNNGNCAHLCLAGSDVGSRTCKCDRFYSLASDGTSCVRDSYMGGNQFLLLAASIEPGIIQISTEKSGDLPSMASVPIETGEKPTAIDFDPLKNIMFWTDVSKKTILKSTLNGGTATVVHKLHLFSVPYGLAVDYHDMMVYYTDEGVNTISRVDYNGYNEKTLISSSLREPRGIALRIQFREMYWTDWGSFPKIEKANMDTGANRTVLISDGIKCPNGLTIDHQEGKLFWCDCFMEKIEMANLDGTNRQILFQETANSVHYFDLTLDSNYIYITDWTASHIKRLNRNDRTFESSWAYLGFKRQNGIVGVNAATLQSPHANRDKSKHTDSGFADASSQSSGKGTTVYIIAGCAVGGLLLIAAFIVVIVCLVRKPCKKKATGNRTDHTYEGLHFQAYSNEAYDRVFPNHSEGATGLPPKY